MSKVFLFACMIALSFAGPYLFIKDYNVGKSFMGDIQYSKFINPFEKHTIVYFKDYNTLSTQLIEKLTGIISSGKHLDYNLESMSCQWGEGPDFIRFLPTFKAAAFIGQGAVSFSNHCFQSNTIEISSSSDTSITITLTSSKSSSFLCYDTYLISILNQFHIENAEFHGKHSITFNNLTENDIYDIQQNGVRVFTFCDDLRNLVIDLAMTLELFAGGFTTNKWLPIIGSHVTWWMEESNVKFLKEAINYTMEKRENTAITLEKSQIKSGTFLAVTRLDGLDEMIMYGSGSRVGHSTVALWVEENGQKDLYILESQAGWYWPRTGIQMNKFETWIKWAEDASFNVVVLPLKPEIQALFNETSAYEWFKTVEGMPYGYHNFMFGWIDTPTLNYPPIVSPELVSIAFQAASKIMPKAIESIFELALNMRLGSKGLNVPELEIEAGKRGMTLLDLMAVVEEEGWLYPDGFSYVCSSFVLALYKRAGILGNLVLQATEFTPRDVYSLNIFEKNINRPQNCIDQDPDIPYCQLMGNYRIDLGDDYSSIEAYDHMDETCPSVAPAFFRPDQC
ncbi:unnamed protein product [Blepharisma stoltei]|uniref:Uncharacterized protein n=1 Tax=Blepharisma stoltei TaxID=1481888 RepID=A0AAU9JK21_9CILI|nr:unnamed protein product [Blepharisma stoltei]